MHAIIGFSLDFLLHNMQYALIFSMITISRESSNGTNYQMNTGYPAENDAVCLPPMVSIKLLSEQEK